MQVSPGGQRHRVINRFGLAEKRCRQGREPVPPTDVTNLISEHDLSSVIRSVPVIDQLCAAAPFPTCARRSFATLTAAEVLRKQSKRSVSRPLRRPGAGATFRVLFKPMSRAGDGSGVGKAEPTGNAAGLRRLSVRVRLVDDEPAVGEFMAELPDSWGLDITVKRNGVEAETLIAADPDNFDLVVTDQTLPKMTGLELARRLMGGAPRPAGHFVYRLHRAPDPGANARRGDPRARDQAGRHRGGFFTLVRAIMK